MSHTSRSMLALLCALACLLLLFGCEEDNPTSVGVTIIINPEPDEINASWSVVGPGGFSAEGSGDRTFENKTAGTYTVTWDPVEGYLQPSRNPFNQSVSDGRTFTFTGTYAADFVDVVRVEPRPANIGATWSLTGPAGFTLDSVNDTLLSEMVAGTYSIIWNKVTGRTKPQPQSYDLIAGGFIHFVGEYNPLPEVNAIIIDVEPDLINAPWSVTNGGSFSQSGNGDFTISNVNEPGDYTLTWGDVVGYVTPVPNSVTNNLVDGDIIEFAAEYLLEDQLVLIPSGGQTFTMGTPVDEPGRKGDEDEHQVTLTKDFYLSPTEVTQAFWAEVVNNEGVQEQIPADQFPPMEPSSFPDCPECPVESINWYDALKFCNAASRLFGLDPAYEYDTSGEDAVWLWNKDANGYRLPTEAEWEFACRGGAANDEGSYYNGLSIYEHGDIPPDPENTAQCFADTNLTTLGWFCNNSGGGTHNAASKAANAYGLYDMLGNVFEICWDTYGGYNPAGATDPDAGFISPQSEVHVMRGGSWQHRARYCRAGSRGQSHRVVKIDSWSSVGMRLARNVDD